MELHEQKIELIIQEARRGGSGACEMPFGNQLHTYEVFPCGLGFVSLI